MIDLSELKLNENILNTFNELIKKDRLPHAILLDGGSTVSRAEVSQYLAASFVCSEEQKPCGKCQNCIKALDRNHPDIIISNPEELNEKTFKIALVRDIRNDAFILPNEAAKKVYILKSADKMNIQAQNALLKIIEEPPAYARFILECESRTSMLDTIMSRVSAFNLGADIIKADDEYLAGAESFAVRLAEALLMPTELDFLRLTAEFEKDKELFGYALSSLQLIFRDAVALNTGCKITIIGNEVSEKLAAKFPLKTLIELVKACDGFFENINKNANKNLLITRFSSVMRKTAYGG